MYKLWFSLSITARPSLAQHNIHRVRVDNVLEPPDRFESTCLTSSLLTGSLFSRARTKAYSWSDTACESGAPDGTLTWISPFIAWPIIPDGRGLSSKQRGATGQHHEYDEPARPYVDGSAVARLEDLGRNERRYPHRRWH